MQLAGLEPAGVQTALKDSDWRNPRKCDPSERELPETNLRRLANAVIAMAADSDPHVQFPGLAYAWRNEG